MPKDNGGKKMFIELALIDNLIKIRPGVASVVCSFGLRLKNVLKRPSLLLRVQGLLNCPQLSDTRRQEAVVSGGVFIHPRHNLFFR